MQRFLIYICILTLGAGCGQSKKVQQKKQLEKAALEVMEIHDRTMKDHGELFKLKKKLLAIEIQEGDSLMAGEIARSISNLETADEDMMNWMHNYKAADESLTFQEQLEYYQWEKGKIESIEINTNLAKQRARDLITIFSQPKE